MTTLTNLLSHRGEIKNPHFEEVENNSKDHAPGTKIGFDPSLIPRLKRQHATLLKIFEQITSYTELHDYPGITHSLEQFKSALYQHLLEEDSRIYTYLKNCLANNAEDAYLMNEMRRRMFALGRSITDFLRHYRDSGVGDDNLNSFKNDLKTIGANLRNRILYEENSIYPLYLPVDQYQSFSIKQHFAKTKTA